MKPKWSYAAILIGFALGGFFDGIVFHQILGWHHMICRTETCLVDSVEALRRQNTDDGFFHAAMLVLTFIGAWRLAVSPRRLNSRAFAAALLVGAGAFNFFEGLIDHEILGIHHVYPRSPHYVFFDLLFLASGLLGMVGGYLLNLRAGTRRSGSAPPYQQLPSTAA